MQLFKKPLFWFILLFFVFGVYKNASISGFQNKSISSDGRGYYAYLPALFIFNDPTFEKSLAAEYEESDGAISTQYYLNKDENGKIFNKYFPGVAVLQLPFFTIASAVAHITGHEKTGYTNTFRNFFFLGQLIYSVLGILLFFACLRILFPNTPFLELKIILLILATPLLYYFIDYASSHSYSFFLFGLFTYFILKLKAQFVYKNVLFTGLILGLISIVRPTNFLIVLIIPFLLGDLANTKSFLNDLFRNKLKGLWLLAIGCTFFFAILLFVIKWQTNQWFFWPYKGEGFNWTSPELFNTFFSFRTGLFWHSPVVLLSILGLFICFKRDRFKVFSFLLYFSVVSYVIASWWCWDYETNFGNRPFTEHVFFLLIPVFYLMRKLPKLTFTFLFIFALIGGIRYYEVTSGSMGNQRFTSSNYFESLAFWKDENKNRWSFNESCKPFGEMFEEALLFNHKEVKKISMSDEFIFTIEHDLNGLGLNNRMYLTIELEKMVDSVPFDEVYIVMDATSTSSKKRSYMTMPLYSDKLEANGKWKKLLFTHFIQDNFDEYDKLTVYVWNKGNRKFNLKKYKVMLQHFMTAR